MGGQNRKNRDCARTRRVIDSRFGALILVHIRVKYAFLPRRRVHFCLFGIDGRVSSYILLPHFVRSLRSLGALLTFFTDYIE